MGQGNTCHGCLMVNLNYIQVVRGSMDLRIRIEKRFSFRVRRNVRAQIKNVHAYRVFN
jgi:hypothetical protein